MYQYIIAVSILLIVYRSVLRYINEIFFEGEGYNYFLIWLVINTTLLCKIKLLKYYITILSKEIQYLLL